MANNVAMAAIAAIGLGLFLLAGAYIVDATVQESRHAISVTNESFAPDGGNLSTFKASNLADAEYDDLVTVRNDSDGSRFEESGNYTWFETNGTLKTTVNSDLAATTTATITYSYDGQTARQAATTNIVVDLWDVLVPLAFVGFVGFFAVAMFTLGRFA